MVKGVCDRTSYAHSYGVETVCPQPPAVERAAVQSSIVRFRPLGVKVRYMMFIRILKTDEPAKVEGYLETGEVVTTDDGC
jgi:hypothetical protein